MQGSDSGSIVWIVHRCMDSGFKLWNLVRFRMCVLGLRADVWGRIYSEGVGNRLRVQDLGLTSGIAGPRNPPERCFA